MTDGDEERVAELERQVAELEATVRGLTEELVDRTERIRQLEAEHGLAGAPPNDGGADESERSDADEAKGTDPEGEDESEDSSGDDIIVA